MTTPGLAWQGCLKMVNKPLELLTNIDMHLFIEQGIQRGISLTTKHFAKANNKYIANYNSEEDSTYIMYLDANNLYGWAMSQLLPYAEFEWMSPVNFSVEWLLSIAVNSLVGYIFEVDLEYPPEIRDHHNDYPLAPEKMNITFEDLSPFSKNILKDGKYTNTVKLVPNLNNFMFLKD